MDLFILQEELVAWAFISGSGREGSCGRLSRGVHWFARQQVVQSAAVLAGDVGITV